MGPCLQCWASNQEFVANVKIDLPLAIRQKLMMSTALLLTVASIIQ